MPQPRLFRFLLLAALAVIAGFLALAIAVPIEPQVPAPLIALFSPGLKLAESIMPETHKSMPWTFGWFLRIAIAANAAFYFAIFALIAYLADRRRSKWLAPSAITGPRPSPCPFLNLKSFFFTSRLSVSYFAWHGSSSGSGFGGIGVRDSGARPLCFGLRKRRRDRLLQEIRLAITSGYGALCAPVRFQVTPHHWQRAPH